jgi:hypothetical protein
MRFRSTFRRYRTGGSLDCQVGKKEASQIDTLETALEEGNKDKCEGIETKSNNNKNNNKNDTKDFGVIDCLDDLKRHGQSII